MTSDRRPIPCAGVVCMRGGEALLVRRANPPRAGEWSLPGGRIAWGEPARAAALRELREETGVVAEIVGVVDVVDALPEADADSRHYVLIDYAARWVSGEPRPGDDAAEAAFFPLQEALRLVEWGETRRVIAAGAALVSGGRERGEGENPSQ